MTPNIRNFGEPTPRQCDVLAAIRDLQVRSGIPPSYGEIAEELGVTKATAADQVRNLEAKGYLTRTEGKYRSLRLTGAALAVLEERDKKKAKEQAA